MQEEITGLKETIYSLDVINRIEHLNENKDDLSEDEKEELEKLEELNKDGENEISDWSLGMAITRHDCFEDYIQDFCEDVGYVPKDLNENIVIDWTETTEKFKKHAVELEFDGFFYYYL